MIYITGDTHGNFQRLSSKQFKEGKELTKDDYLIICGDFALVWSPIISNGNTKTRGEEPYWRKWLDDKPWTTLFIDGNHENHTRLAACESIKMFGGTVGHVSKSIYHLRRGEIYEIEGKKIFCFGGGHSIDKADRKPDITWWEAEMPTSAEYEHGFKQLETAGNNVDYIITHSCSHDMFHKLQCFYPREFNNKINGEDALRMYFNILEERTQFKMWFFGHMHVDVMLDDKHMAMYNNIVPITIGRGGSHV